MSSNYNKPQHTSRVHNQRPTAALKHLANCKTGCLQNSCAPGTFGMFFCRPAHPVSGDWSLDDHPILLLDRRFNLPGNQHKNHRACLIVTKSPQGPSLPLRHLRKPHPTPKQEALYQRADGHHVMWLWEQDNEVCFAIKMLHESCLHHLRWKSGKVHISSALDAASLRAVEGHVTRALHKKQVRRPRTGPPDSEGWSTVQRSKVAASSQMYLASHPSA